jgi:hypothetical protein
MVVQPRVGPMPHVLVRAMWPPSGTSSHIVSPGKILTPKKSSLRLSSVRSVKLENTQYRDFLLCIVINQWKGVNGNSHNSMQNINKHLITWKYVGMYDNKLQSLGMHFTCIRWHVGECDLVSGSCHPLCWQHVLAVYRCFMGCLATCTIWLIPRVCNSKNNIKAFLPSNLGYVRYETQQKK